MQLTKKEVRGVVVVGIHGKLLGGSDESDKFHQVFKTIIDDGKKYVVVDLHRTSYANSVGIGMLIGAYTSMKNSGGDLVLANVIDRINNILVVTQLCLIFKTFDSVDEAVDYLLEKAKTGQDIDTDSKPAASKEPPPQEKRQEL
jgi:anti-sigma B factor antagonist